MTWQEEQQICIKFCIKLEHSSAETIWMIQEAFRDNVMSAAQIKVWHKCFKDSWESVESDPQSGYSTSRIPENVERVWATINKYRQLTVWELEADLGIPKTTMSEILTQDLGMKCVVAKFILRLLLPEQREHHAIVAKDLFQTTTNDTGRTVWGPKVPTWRGLRHHYFLYLVSFSRNVSIFHSAWLYTLWTDLGYQHWVLCFSKIRPMRPT